MQLTWPSPFSFALLQGHHALEEAKQVTEGPGEQQHMLKQQHWARDSSETALLPSAVTSPIAHILSKRLRFAAFPFILDSSSPQGVIFHFPHLVTSLAGKFCLWWSSQPPPRFEPGWPMGGLGKERHLSSPGIWIAHSLLVSSYRIRIALILCLASLEHRR